jgi:hypothetical protein
MPKKASLALESAKAKWESAMANRYCFDSHAHLSTLLLQLPIKPLSFSSAVHQRSFTHFSAVRLYPRDLLKTRVIITTYNQHA